MKSTFSGPTGVVVVTTSDEDLVPIFTE